MAEYVPSKKWSDLKGMSLEEISKQPCLEITDDEGKMIGVQGAFLMVATTDYIRARMDSHGLQSNSLWVEAEVKAPLYVSDKSPKKKRRKVAVA